MSPGNRQRPVRGGPGLRAHCGSSAADMGEEDGIVTGAPASDTQLFGALEQGLLKAVPSFRAPESELTAVEVGWCEGWYTVDVRAALPRQPLRTSHWLILMSLYGMYRAHKENSTKRRGAHGDWHVLRRTRGNVMPCLRAAGSHAEHKHTVIAEIDIERAVASLAFPTSLRRPGTRSSSDAFVQPALPLTAAYK